jgi:hypothetical protein
MTRRRFVFWIGLGLFNLAELFRADRLDALAAAVMDAAGPSAGEEPITEAEATAMDGGTRWPEHWTACEDEEWRWFERENFINGRWALSGSTTPVHKETGRRKALSDGYLEDELVPAHMWRSEKERQSEPFPRRPERPSQVASSDAEPVGPHEQLPSVARRARHGRPPSQWLRSLNAEEIRIWLKTIDVPEAGVSGMTYWTHLTRDHGFEAARIEGLVIADQAKLHAAAHYGY